MLAEIYTSRKLLIAYVIAEMKVLITNSATKCS